jgi:predicted CopG family antitoxin
MDKTITIQEETWKNLNLMKYTLGTDTLDELIIKLILNYKGDMKNENRENSRVKN